MYCPETIKFSTEHLSIIHYARTDYIQWKYVPLSEKLNLLRYEIIINPKGYNQDAKQIRINREGMWAVKFSNVIYQIKKFLRLA